MADDTLPLFSWLENARHNASGEDDSLLRELASYLLNHPETDMRLRGSPQEKFCPRCKLTKPNSEFSIARAEPSGLHWRCRSCEREAYFIKKEENPEKTREQNRVKAARWRERHPDKAYEASRKFRTKDGGERTREIARRGYNKDPAKHIARRRDWEKANPEKRTAEKLRWQKRRGERDPMFRMMRNIGRHIAGILKGEKRGRKTEALIGYTATDLRAHVEALFELGMTWENYGAWHLDHARPKASYDFETDVEAVRQCWALTNLKPLWRSENQRKAAIWDGINWHQERLRAARSRQHERPEDEAA